MLYQLGIKDGFGQLKGYGTHVKIVSAVTKVRIEALSDSGQVILQTEMRAPMATMFPATAATVNLYSDTDQTVEVWYARQPLEYMQLVSVGATRVKAQRTLIYPGKTKIADAAPRKSIRMTASANIKMGDESVNDNGWPIAAQEKEEFETSGEIWAFTGKPIFDWQKLNDAATTVFADAATTVPMADYARFNNGFVFAPNNSNQARFLDELGAATACNLINTQALFTHTGRLFAVSTAPTVDGTAPFIFESTDGVNFGKIRKLWASDGSESWFLLFNQGGFLNIVGDWVNFEPPNHGPSGANQRKVAVNVLTGECKQSPVGMGTGPRSFYDPNTTKWWKYEADGVYIQNGEGWLKVSDVFGQTVLALMITEQGRIIARVSGKLYEVFEDGTTLLMSTSATTNETVRYIKGSGGVLFSVSGISTSVRIIYAPPTGDTEHFTVSGVFSYMGNPLYSSAEKKIYFFKFDTSPADATVRQIGAPDLPELEAVEVKTLEFLI